MHRDLKPQNVLLTKDQRAKLSDMGFSKRLPDNQSYFESSGIGTPASCRLREHAWSTCLAHPGLTCMKSLLYMLAIALLQHACMLQAHARMPGLGGSMQQKSPTTVCQVRGRDASAAIIPALLLCCRCMHCDIAHGRKLTCLLGQIRRQQRVASAGAAVHD